MKIVAAIMDISFVKKFHGQYRISKVKKCLVYDPRIVTSRHVEKKEDE